MVSAFRIIYCIYAVCTCTCGQIIVLCFNLYPDRVCQSIDDWRERIFARMMISCARVSETQNASQKHKHTTWCWHWPSSVCTLSLARSLWLCVRWVYAMSTQQHSGRGARRDISFTYVPNVWMYVIRSWIRRALGVFLFVHSRVHVVRVLVTHAITIQNVAQS